MSIFFYIFAGERKIFLIDSIAFHGQLSFIGSTAGTVVSSMHSPGTVAINPKRFHEQKQAPGSGKPCLIPGACFCSTRDQIMGRCYKWSPLL
jgi:hypothetical protein